MRDERDEADAPTDGQFAGFALGEPIGFGGFASVFALAGDAHAPSRCIKIGDGGDDTARLVHRVPNPYGLSPYTFGIAAPPAAGLREITGPYGLRLSARVSTAEVRAIMADECATMRAGGERLFPAVYASGEHDGLPYYVMERIPHPTLRAAAQGAYPPALFLPALAALTRELWLRREADAAFFHGDLKPENILATPSGWRLIDPAMRRRDTATGDALLGTVTPAYNPLLLAGERADTLALLVVLLEYLTGVQPFRDVAVSSFPRTERQIAQATVDAIMTQMHTPPTALMGLLAPVAEGIADPPPLAALLDYLDRETDALVAAAPPDARLAPPTLVVPTIIPPSPPGPTPYPPVPLYSPWQSLADRWFAAATGATVTVSFHLDAAPVAGVLIAFDATHLVLRLPSGETALLARDRAQQITGSVPFDVTPHE